jgi:hypothetical protein
MAKKAVGSMFNDLIGGGASTAGAIPGKAPGVRQRNKPVSVYLSMDEKQTIETIAAALGVNRHALLKYAVSYFVKEYEAGKIKPKTTTQTITTLDQN